MDFILNGKKGYNTFYLKLNQYVNEKWDIYKI